MRTIRDVKKYMGYMLYSARACLKAEVANSYLNWVWWVLEPFCFMLIYAIIFGVIFAQNIENFPVYIFIGNTIWAFFSKTIFSSVTMIRRNETIIAKVYIPKYMLLIVEMLVNGFKMVISFGIVGIMLIVFHIRISLNIVWMIPIMIVFFMITFGIGTIMMHCGVYIDDLSYAMNIVLQMLMYFTGIFFSIEQRVPEPFCTILGVYNPVAFLLTSARKTIMYASMPDAVLLFIWFMVALLVDAFGVKLIYKNENNYVKIM